MSPMRRVRTMASSAAPMPTSTAMPEMTTTRWSTGAYSGGGSTVASDGASDGATGSPLAALRGVGDSSATRHASSGLVLEHHRWCGEIDAAREHPSLQQLGEHRALFGLHARHAVHEIALHGWWRSAQHAVAIGRERDLHAPAICLRRHAGDQTTLDEPSNDYRNRALMRRRAISELVEGFGGLFGQLLEHEQLRETDAEFAFDTARVEAQCPDDAANRIHGAEGVVGTRRVD